MGQQIRWSEKSAQDLQEIFNYIARNSESYARIAVRRIAESLDPLEDFPLLGRIVPEFDDPTLRELIVYSYRVIYKVIPGSVNVVGVIHGARRLKRALKGRKF